MGAKHTRSPHPPEICVCVEVIYSKAQVEDKVASQRNGTTVMMDEVKLVRRDVQISPLDTLQQIHTTFMLDLQDWCHKFNNGNFEWKEVHWCILDGLKAKKTMRPRATISLDLTVREAGIVGDDAENGYNLLTFLGKEVARHFELDMPTQKDVSDDDEASFVKLGKRSGSNLDIVQEEGTVPPTAPMEGEHKEKAGK